MHGAQVRMQAVGEPGGTGLSGYSFGAMAGWGVACCAAGFATAWCSKPEPPARIEERVVTVERKQEAIQWAWKGEAQKRADVSTRVVVKTRWLPSPAGPVVERTEETATDAHEEAHAQVAEVRVEVRTVEKLVERERLVEGARPGWRIEASAGWELSENPGQFGVELSRRLGGPWWVGVEARSDKSAALLVAVEW